MIHYVSNHMSDRLKKEKTSVPAVQPWQKLANAIVEQAVEDYRKAQARIKANPMIADHPLCAKCRENGKLTPATVVDHIIPHRGDPVLFWDRSNWQPLCKDCHDRKTGSGL